MTVTVNATGSADIRLAASTQAGLHTISATTNLLSQHISNAGLALGSLQAVMAPPVVPALAAAAPPAVPVSHHAPGAGAMPGGAGSHQGHGGAGNGGAGRHRAQDHVPNGGAVEPAKAPGPAAPAASDVVSVYA